MISLLKRWVARKAAGVRPLPVTLYSRQGCTCCDKAKAVLEQTARRLGYALELDVVDIDTDLALVARYDTQVPVVVINGKERFRGTVNAVLLERLLVALRKES